MSDGAMALHGVPPGTGRRRKPVGAPWVRTLNTSAHQTAHR
jgi:hypothetical protein